MPLPIYPDRALLVGLTYESRWVPRFLNLSEVTASGAAIDLAQAQYPLHDFELTYSVLRDGPRWGSTLAAIEFRTMMGFFLSLNGSLGRFLYRNPDDDQIFRTRIGTGDGTTTAFTITRSFGANGYVAAEPVGQVNLDAGVNVYLAGSSTPVDPALYTIDTATPVANTITFDTAPADAAAIEMDLSYFYYCRLADSQLTFTRFMDKIWNLEKIVLQSCRVSA